MSVVGRSLLVMLLVGISRYEQSYVKSWLYDSRNATSRKRSEIFYLYRATTAYC
jgi:hypothetical protein